MIKDGVAEIRRVAYDIEATVAGIRKLELAEDATQALITILRTGRPLGDPLVESGAGSLSKP